MTRRTKKKSGTVLGNDRSPLTINTSTFKNTKRNFKVAARPPQPSVEIDISDSSEDELARQVALPARPAKKTSITDSRKQKEMLSTLQNTAEYLSSLGDEKEIERIMQLPGSRNNEALLKHRATLLDLLANKSEVHHEVPETLGLYDQYFAHQGPNKQLYILRPVEVIQGNTNLTRGKVAGFIRHSASEFPLKYALPGWVPCHNDHPNVLNSAFWTDEAQRWGEFHNHKFPSHPFEQKHGKAKGHASASHVEVRLMLWFACEKLKQLQGYNKPIRALLGEASKLWRLRDYDETDQAEIFLTREPCDACKEIKKLIEEYTRISFVIHIMPNLGVLEPKRKYGWVTFDNFAPNPENEAESDDEPRGFSEDIRLDSIQGRSHRIEVVEREKTVERIEKFKKATGARSSAKTAIEVIIPARNNPAESSSVDSSPAPRRQTKNPSSVSTTTTSITRHIRGFSYQPAHAIESESEDPEYLPPDIRRPKTSKKAAQYGLPMPQDSPFSAQARKQAELLRKQKQKRARDRGLSGSSSTSAAKKSR